jgi:ABC-type sulfate transport system substrate-binding protein
VRHVPGRKYTAADGLLRHPRTESNNIDEQNEEDIKDFLDTELAILSISPISVVSENSEKSEDFKTSIKILNETYSEESQYIANYLTTLRKPEGLTVSEFC